MSRSRRIDIYSWFADCSLMTFAVGGLWRRIRRDPHHRRGRHGRGDLYVALLALDRVPRRCGGAPGPVARRPPRRHELLVQGLDQRAAAAAFGSDLIERSKGRPSIDPEAQPGQHSRAVQARVGDSLDRALAELARAQHRSKSAVVRDALAAYVAAH